MWSGCKPEAYRSQRCLFSRHRLVETTVSFGSAFFGEGLDACSSLSSLTLVTPPFLRHRFLKRRRAIDSIQFLPLLHSLLYSPSYSSSLHSQKKRAELMRSFLSPCLWLRHHVVLTLLARTPTHTLSFWLNAWSPNQSKSKSDRAHEPPFSGANGWRGRKWSTRLIMQRWVLLFSAN
jgi:hypothetical protein